MTICRAAENRSRLKMLPWIFFILFNTASADTSRSDLETKIVSSIYFAKRFNSYIRPHRNETFDEPVAVRIDLHILHLDVNAKTQEFDLSMYFRQEWNDDRYAYDGEGKLSSVTLHDVIGFWTPDLFFVNEHSAHFHIVTKPNTFAKIFPDGRILLSQRLSVKASCPMNLRRYPFDKLACPLRIESYGYTTDDLTLEWKSGELPVTGSPNVVGYDTSYGHKNLLVNAGGNGYSAAELEIHLKRLLTDFFLHVYLPITLLVIVSWITFFLTPESSVLRLTISLTTVVSTQLGLIINNHLFIRPGYPTALDVWVAFSCSLLFAVFFENVHVIYAGRKNEKFDCQHAQDQTKKTLLTVVSSVIANADRYAKIFFPSIFVLFQFFYIIYIFSDSSSK